MTNGDIFKKTPQNKNNKKPKQKPPGPKLPKLEVSEMSSPSQRNCENYSSLLKRNSHWNANFDFDYLSRPALKFFRQK